MGGQRNSKLLRMIVGAVVVVIALYVLYGYRQATNEAASKSHHLRLAEDEFHSLNKRFDMLSNELKGESEPCGVLIRAHHFGMAVVFSVSQLIAFCTRTQFEQQKAF